MVAGSLSARERVKPLPPRYGEQLDELCPYYMSIGMTYDEYWNGDNQLPKYFRKKHNLEREEKNFFLWLQGAYVYEAILDASPALRAFSKKTKPVPYRSEPIDLKLDDKKRKEEKNNQKMKNGIEHMRMMMAGINKRFENGKGS